MAIREFDGVDDRILLGGSGIALANGARSCVLLTKPLNIQGPFRFFVSFARTTGLNPLFSVYDSGNVAGEIWHGVFFASDTGIDADMTEDQWQILGWSKPSGSTVLRGHRKVLGSGSWTHINTSASVGNDATAWTATEVGAGDNGGANEFKNMRMAVIALFDIDLSDANYVSLESAASTQAIYDLDPIGLWEFNQANVTDNVLDLVGNSDQTGRTGTTVIAGDDPAWTFGISGPVVAWIRA